MHRPKSDADADRATRERSRSERPGSTPDRRAGVGALHGAVGNQAVRALHERGELQAKLAVGSADDAAEREAERVADEVLSSPATNGAARTATPGGVTDRAGNDTTVDTAPTSDPATARTGDTGRTPPTVRRRGPTGRAGSVDGDTEGQIRSLRSGGQPLPTSTRAFFESRFGRDFSGVRVHTGSQADEAARSIDAEAFTLGTDIAFAEGNYRPHTTAGRRLLAHELTHVVQQDGDPGAVQRQESLESAAAGVAEELVTTAVPQSKYVIIAGKLATAAADGIGKGIEAARERLNREEGPPDQAALVGTKNIICKRHPNLEQCKGYDPNEQRSQEEVYEQAMRGTHLTRRRYERALAELDDVALAGLTAMVEKLKDIVIEETLGVAAGKLTEALHGKLVDLAKAAREKLADHVVGWDIFGGWDSLNQFLSEASEAEIEEAVNTVKSAVETDLKEALSVTGE